MEAPGQWTVRGRIERFVEPAVLLLLAEGSRHGYELKEQVRQFLGEDHTDVANLYRLLRQLEVERIVRSRWCPPAGGPARRVYDLTSMGRRLLEEWVVALRRVQNATDTFLTRYDAPRPCSGNAGRGAG
jgi:poly-beta-hydroxybutyrate-responsive repressor